MSTILPASLAGYLRSSSNVRSVVQGPPLADLRKKINTIQADVARGHRVSDRIQGHDRQEKMKTLAMAIANVFARRSVLEELRIPIKGYTAGISAAQAGKELAHVSRRLPTLRNGIYPPTNYANDFAIAVVKVDTDIDWDIPMMREIYTAQVQGVLYDLERAIDPGTPKKAAAATFRAYVLEVLVPAASDHKLENGLRRDLSQLGHLGKNLRTFRVARQDLVDRQQLLDLIRSQPEAAPLVSEAMVTADEDRSTTDFDRFEELIRRTHAVASITRTYGVETQSSEANVANPSTLGLSVPGLGSAAPR